MSKNKPENKVVEMKAQATEYCLTDKERKFVVDLLAARQQVEMQAQMELQKINLSLNAALTLLLHQHGLTEGDFVLNEDATKLVPAPTPEQRSEAAQ